MSTAQIEVNLDLTTVYAHYMQQIADAGWTRTGEGTAGPCHWSTWRVDDDEGGPWSGVFLAIEQTGQPGHFFLSMLMSWSGHGTPLGPADFGSRGILSSSSSSATLSAPGAPGAPPRPPAPPERRQGDQEG